MATKPFRILTLDGGGAKGIYTLGILTEIEALVGKPLCDHFDLIYGTSTGAIIAAMIGLGLPISTVRDHYMSIIPSVFSAKLAFNRSTRLRHHGRAIFQNARFENFRTLVGIVATDVTNGRPKIFKSNKGQSFSRATTFEPGFGATILESLIASSAAIPVLKSVQVKTANQGEPTLVDGGFVANNPTLFAMIDVIGSLNIELSEVRLISLGTGEFTSPKKSIWQKALSLGFPINELFGALDANAKATEFLVKTIFPDLAQIRINDSNPNLTCDMQTTDLKILEKAFVLGRDSFAKFEPQLKVILEK